MYEKKHLGEIQKTKILQTNARTPQERILQTRVLVEHFLFYQSDSCLHYVDQAIRQARQQNDKSTENQMICRKAIAYALSGLPWEGEALLDSLLQTPLDRSSKNEVFKAEIDILEQFQNQDLPNDLVTRNYMRMETLEDSVSKYDPEPHSRLLRLKYRNNSEQEMIDRLKTTLSQSNNNTEKAAYAMIIAGKCQQQNELKERNKYWAIAAIYDVEAHKMISSALVRLATLMMEQGDWERATRYAQEASKRAVFYRARSQNYELSPILESSYPFITLHIKPHSLTESIAMPRHIYFRNNCYPTFCRIVLQFATFFLSIITSRITDHILGSRELRIGLYFKPPGQLFCQMPMKDINFKTGK